MSKWSFYVVCHCTLCLPENTLSKIFVKLWNSQVTGVYASLLMYIPGMLAACKYICVSNLSLGSRDNVLTVSQVDLGLGCGLSWQGLILSSSHECGRGSSPWLALVKGHVLLANLLALWQSHHGALIGLIISLMADMVPSLIDKATALRLVILKTEWGRLIPLAKIHLCL